MFNGLSIVLYSVVLILIYGTMEFTDLIDGKIARKRGLVTDLGKVLDPFADVICHLTFFTCFLVSSIMPVWAFVLIMWREFSQSFMRMLLMGKGKPMAANIFGKAKTCLYAFCSICGFAVRILMQFGKLPSFANTVMTVLWALAAFASVMSFAIYINNVRKEGTLKSLTR